MVRPQVEIHQEFHTVPNPEWTQPLSSPSDGSVSPHVAPAGEPIRGIRAQMVMIDEVAEFDPAVLSQVQAAYSPSRVLTPQNMAIARFAAEVPRA